MAKGKSWIFVYCLTAAAVLFAAHFGSRAATAMAEHTPMARKSHILIDPGHGGEDGGATSCTGRLESTYNLEISLRLGDLFRLLGYDTRLVRTTDTSVYTQGETIAQKKVSDLKERVAMAGEQEGTLVLSIHQNQYPDPKYAGAQVFYPKTPGSDRLAKELQQSFVSTLNPGSRRQAKPAKGIYLMEKLPCTGVLIECGFLSNPQEEAKLRDGDYQKKLCCIIASGVSRFLQEESQSK